MKRFSLVCLLLCLQSRNSDAADDGCKNGAKSNSITLKNQLFCSYDSSVRPVKLHTNVTEVSIKMWLKFFVFNEHYNSLEVHSWVVWKWVDDHLKWDKNEHAGLDRLQILSSEIWTPDVTTYNPGSAYDSSTGMPETRCTVNNKGNLTCVSPTVYTALCAPNIRNWPFDSHKCTMRVGSWSYKGGELNLTMDGKGVTIADYEENREWELVDANATRVSMEYKNDTYPWINFSFEMKRHPGGAASSVVIPSIVLAVLTLVTFWINPESVHRLGLICVNIVCHCLFMIYVGVMLPANGDDTPIIVTFFRDSFLLAAVSLLVTLCAARMNTAARAPPSWISSITDGILALPPGQLLLLGELDPKGVAAARAPAGTEENAELVGAAPSPEGWKLFATLLDRIFFIATFLALFILLCAYIP